MRQIKRKLDELLNVQAQSTSAITQREFKKRRENSPMHGNTDSMSTSSQTNEVTKELIKLIPRYDGSGGIQRFLEFVDNFEDFTSNADLPTLTELTLATAKLTGDAKMWWREHRNTTQIDDPRRIRNWDMLQKALMKTFVPVETADDVRSKLRTLRQKNTVAEYNAAFRRLSMQITMEFAEAKFAYLQGLSPKIRDLIRTKDDITDIRELQLACLRLDDVALE